MRPWGNVAFMGSLRTLAATTNLEVRTGASEARILLKTPRADVKMLSFRLSVTFLGPIEPAHSLAEDRSRRSDTRRRRRLFILRDLQQGVDGRLSGALHLRDGSLHQLAARLPVAGDEEGVLQGAKQRGLGKVAGRSGIFDGARLEQCDQRRLLPAVQLFLRLL